LSKTRSAELIPTSDGKSSSKAQLYFIHSAPRGNGPVDESYGLEIAPAGVRISASSRSGYFYGVVSLWQMLAQNARTLPALRIEDQPRFRWRGLMLDSARHIQSEEFILHLLDYRGQHKLNVLHWHLTDDQGWLIEISVFAVRDHVTPNGRGIMQVRIDSCTGELLTSISLAPALRKDGVIPL